MPTTERSARRDGITGAHRSEDGRHETEAERIDRNLLELLQELRVAGIGVQVLFGFLLAIPFTTQYDKLDDAQQVLYTVDLVLAALAIALLSAPVAHHRVLFRQHEKKSILRVANAAAIAGLVAVGLTISGALLLVVSFVWHGAVVWLVSVPTALAIFVLWFVPPMLHGDRDSY